MLPQQTKRSPKLLLLVDCAAGHMLSFQDNHMSLPSDNAIHQTHFLFV